jgi:dTDP-4-amino-4,6-dideoxygalactose transaminase
VHYTGVSCKIDAIMDITQRHNLVVVVDAIMDIATKHKVFIIEDAAQGMMSTYKSRALGAIGHMGTYSFHTTKNYTSGGEGCLLMINDERFVARAEIIREKDTNRSKFLAVWAINTVGWMLGISTYRVICRRPFSGGSSKKRIRLIANV